MSSRSNRPEYSKVMVFGTGAPDANGQMQLTEIAKRRGDRAAEAFYIDEDKNILISGGYGKEHFDTPPVVSEAKLLQDYLAKAYRIPLGRMALEEASTDTEQNLLLSVRSHPDFFTGITVSKEKLGLVSQAEHLKYIIEVGRRVLRCSEEQLVPLVAYQPQARRILTPNNTESLREQLFTAAD